MMLQFGDRFIAADYIAEVCPHPGSNSKTVCIVTKAGKEYRTEAEGHETKDMAARRIAKTINEALRKA